MRRGVGPAALQRSRASLAVLRGLAGVFPWPPVLMLLVLPVLSSGALYSRKTAPVRPFPAALKPLSYSLPKVLFSLSGSRNGGLEKSL
jgi:hypothetical protein